MSSSTTSPTREPKWALPQVQVIRYLTEHILYEGNITPVAVEWFLRQVVYMVIPLIILRSKFYPTTRGG
ncbi:hypothetical protein F5B17DRAFT_420836 [Nemania serpens]|nr:hypothetical protein F5B17DRAFT_420836 [Nemania serpens]